MRSERNSARGKAGGGEALGLELVLRAGGSGGGEPCAARAQTPQATRHGRHGGCGPAQPSPARAWLAIKSSRYPPRSAILTASSLPRSLAPATHRQRQRRRSRHRRHPRPSPPPPLATPSPFPFTSVLLPLVLPPHVSVFCIHSHGESANVVAGVGTALGVLRCSRRW